jgi:signal peptidase II
MLRFVGWSLLIVALDQLSKYWMLTHFQPHEVLPVWPVFNLTLVFNTGAAFSFLADSGGWQQFLFVGLASVISVVLVVWLARLQQDQRLLAWALTLVLGGAVGNLVDRLVHGKVVDFLQWHWQGWYFPAFNLADSAITLGVILLLIDGLFGRSRREL